MGIHRDLIPEGADLSGYKVLFTPFLPYVSPEFLKRASEFVRQGGIWVAGPLTGGRTEEHTIPVDAGLGAELELLAGVETLYTYPMDKTGTKGRAFGVETELSLWSAVFKPVEAEAVGVLVDGLCPGEAFITERRLGAGKIVLVGSTPTGDDGNELWAKLIEHYAAEAGVTVRTDATPGTIVAQRQGEDCELWIIVNMDGTGGTVTLPANGVDAVTNEPVEAGQLHVGRYEYRAIRFAASE
jgi:beta-galactosidase